MATASHWLGPEAFMACLGSDQKYLSLQNFWCQGAAAPLENCFGSRLALPVPESGASEVPQPGRSCFSTQAGDLKSWEAEPVPGRTREGLPLLLRVNPVT